MRAGRLREAIQQYPESNAVLVRRHGVYVWGKDWIQAKTQAECYHYLFEAALRMKLLGINASLPQAPTPLQNGLANGHAKESAPSALSQHGSLDTKSSVPAGSAGTLQELQRSPWQAGLSVSMSARKVVCCSTC